MCYKNCHLATEFWADSIKKKNEKASEVFCVQCITKIVTCQQNFKLTQYRRRRNSNERFFVSNVLQKLSHVNRIVSWLNIEEEEIAMEVFCAQSVTKIVTCQQNFELTQYRRRKKKQGKFFMPNMLQKLSLGNRILSWLNI